NGEPTRGSLNICIPIKEYSVALENRSAYTPHVNMEMLLARELVAEQKRAKRTCNNPRPFQNQHQHHETRKVMSLRTLERHTDAFSFPEGNIVVVGLLRCH
ncbi:unnamed protein product, partial [Ectocarpus sp. 12 AP-2014]